MKQKILFVCIFTILGYLALQIPLTHLAGSKAAFTLYDCIAPIAGAFIGTAPGIIAVFLVQFFSFISHGAHIQDAGPIIRFFPMLFAVYYFARKDISNIIVPVIAILTFVAHPTGRTVWYFALFWVIPIAAYFLRDRFLLARALGATFSAHAVGGTLWMWTFMLPASAWTALIPLVIKERILFALGMVGVFIAFNNLIAWAKMGKFSFSALSCEPRYLIRSLRTYVSQKTPSA